MLKAAWARFGREVANKLSATQGVLDRALTPEYGWIAETVGAKAAVCPSNNQQILRVHAARS
jgi:hypothetical protein